MNTDPVTETTVTWAVDVYHAVRGWVTTTTCPTQDAAAAAQILAGPLCSTRIVRVETTITRTPLHESARR